MSAPPAINALPSPGPSEEEGGRHRRRRRGWWREVRLESEAGARAQESVNEGTAQAEKGSTGVFFRRWPLSHYILDSPPGRPNDSRRMWREVAVVRVGVF